ncbi:MAG TPA: M28 family peptidase [Bryobacteraceae bacterium]|nr:M28 family peptidase [Bryobacteraceae bacterium]
MRRISADALRGNLSFLASDALEGRNTPSRGLDIAAEFIASQFRSAGLEPAGDDGYFQTAELKELEPAKEGFEMKIEQGGRTIAVAREAITSRFYAALELEHAGIYKLDRDNEKALASLKPEDVAGKVVVAELPEFGGTEAEGASRKFREEMRAIERAKPRLALLLASHPLPEVTNRFSTAETRAASEKPRIVVRSAEVSEWYRTLKPGPTDATLTLHLAPAQEKPVKLRNVIGLLRGSDPELRDTYVLLTAHYDHLGVGPEGAVFHGANDDGSGTVSVMEIASALAKMDPRPKRSVVFMTFFGEEEGELGSKYYAEHPVFPVEKTVADVNLEQLGRTDASDGAQIDRATFTGFRYSNLPRIFQEAGARTGVRVLSDEKYGDSYFARSDNEALAKLGVPAHTLAVAFEFPDYHLVTDTWQKIDYENMAKVDRMVALGVIMLADDAVPPKWNAAEPQAEPYAKAWKTLHKQN